MMRHQHHHLSISSHYLPLALPCLALPCLALPVLAWLPAIFCKALMFATWPSPSRLPPIREMTKLDPFAWPKPKTLRDWDALRLQLRLLVGVLWVFCICVL
jgi:hypothetical protein